METRALPVLDFAGDKFIVDVLNSQFIEKANPDNKLSFRCMKGENDHYVLTYDRSTHKAYNVEEQLPLPVQVKLINIKAMIAIDPIGVARKYGFPDHAFIESFREEVPDITDLCRIIPFPDYRNMPPNRA